MSGEAYHAQFDQSPLANDDCVLYMANEHPTWILIIEGIWLQIDGAGEIYFKISDEGTRNSASAVIPANLNAKAGNDAQGTFEEGTDLDGGAATLTGGTEIERYIFVAAMNSQHFNFEADVVLGLGNTFTIWGSDSTRTIHGTVVFHYYEEVH